MAFRACTRGAPRARFQLLKLFTLLGDRFWLPVGLFAAHSWSICDESHPSHPFSCMAPFCFDGKHFASSSL
ncbi:hypothetical protein HZ326_24740 [Fusarium oxysporum f. sp. albedinis]|nr:hypothetical protein HZ326_24740 [Fusarium oxysporum f. sp. albedinis]